MQKKAPSAYSFVQTAIEQIASSLALHINKNCEPEERLDILSIFGLSALDSIDAQDLQQYIIASIDNRPPKAQRKRLRSGEPRSSVRGRPKKVSLDVRDMLILHLRFLGKTFAQIANVLDCSRQAVHTRHTRVSDLINKLAIGRYELIAATPILNYVQIKKPKK